MKTNNFNYGPVHDLNLKLVVALHRSIQRDEKSLMEALAPHGLTIAQFGVLEVLYHKGPLRICDIIEKTLSSSGNMTVVIKNLEKAGYIERHRDPDDGRAFVVTLTEAGKQLISEVFPKHLKGLEQAYGNLTAPQKEELLKLLKTLNGI